MMSWLLDNGTEVNEVSLDIKTKQHLPSLASFLLYYDKNRPQALHFPLLFVKDGG